MTFSMRESQILDLLRTVQTNKEIAQNLGISANTVRDHIRRMMLRTGLKTRVVLAALYISQDMAVVWCPVKGPERRNSINRRAPVVLEHPTNVGLRL